MIARNPVLDDEPESTRLDLDTRVDLSIAFGCYVNAEREFNLASRRFTEACKELREILPPGRRFVIRHDAANYLVESDANGDFDIETIESL